MIVAAKAATGVSKVTLPYLWVAVGDSGKLYTSDLTDASSWTSRTSSFSTTLISGVASDGVSQYVAVGLSGKLATSPDGTTWTQRTSSFSTSSIQAVAYGNGVWVAAGNDNKLATSTDGITWTQRTTGGTTEVWTSVAFANGLWVILATNGAMRTATDPTSTWTSRTSTLTSGNQVYYDPTVAIWVAGREQGTTGALASSTDGTTWTARNAAVTPYGGAFASNTSVIVFGYPADSGGITSGVSSSTNGTTWTTRTLANTSFILRCAASDNQNLIIVMGTDGFKVQSSTDAITWTDRGAISGFSARFVCHSSGTPSIR